MIYARAPHCSLLSTRVAYYTCASVVALGPSVEVLDAKTVKREREIEGGKRGKELGLIGEGY